MTNVLLTGSSGFVGSRVEKRLVDAGLSVVRAVRGETTERGAIQVGSIGPTTDWRRALEGCDAVIHLAAVLPSRGISSYSFRHTNDEGTFRLVEQARDAGVVRIIALSSIAAVSGNAADEMVHDLSAIEPTSDYGRSKRALEAHVASFAGEGRTGISIRPPMVYGATTKGNWYLLKKLAATNLPLPFGAVHNRRTMISVDNLADAVVTAFRRASPERSGIYSVADSESVSLVQILTWLREGMGKPARLVSLPPALIAASLKMAGFGIVAQSLLGNLEIDAARFRQTFNWSSPESSYEAIRRSGREFVVVQR